MGVGIYREEQPHISLKYINTKYQCFSEWEKRELKIFSSLIKKLRKTTWAKIHRTGGKNKSGLGLTKHKSRKTLPETDLLSEISEDINFYELRVNEKARIHGFKLHATFFLVWLDKSHKICQ